MATLILYGQLLGLLMASILSPGARIIQHKCGKRSDGGREAGEGSGNFFLEGVLALSISSSWLASFPIIKKLASSCCQVSPCRSVQADVNKGKPFQCRATVVVSTLPDWTASKAIHLTWLVPICRLQYLSYNFSLRAFE